MEIRKIDFKVLIESKALGLFIYIEKWQQNNVEVFWLVLKIPTMASNFKETCWMLVNLTYFRCISEHNMDASGQVNVTIS